ncbi:MAG: VOC family protein [bacterium]|nr:VOC family protein [bacterium]
MATRLRHVVLAVSDLENSARFYTEGLGMERMYDLEALNMVFLSFGELDHDIALIKADEEAHLGSQVFSHNAFEIDGGEAALRALYQRLQDYGAKIELTADHGLSKSLYCFDPDGNRLEFFFSTMEPKDAMAFMRAGRAGLDPYDIMGTTMSSA